MIEMN